MKSTDKVKSSIPTPKELNVNALQLIHPLFSFNSFGVGRQFGCPPVDFIYGYSHSILSGFLGKLLSTNSLTPQRHYKAFDALLKV
jgi:hypothetical protein